MTAAAPAPAAVTTEGLVRRFGAVRALDGVDVRLEAGAVHGLLGRNGAGKTTFLQLVAGQQVPTSGRVEVFGEDPFDAPRTLARLCLVREGQRYPDGYRVRHVLAAAALTRPGWDAAYAGRLAAAFDLPPDRAVTKLSRGMLSAVGVVVGLASRAPLTLFDEPYLGLDAVARQRFYDELLADLARHPRTVVLSTHLIAEVADLLDHVVVLDRGRVLLDADADTLRGEAVQVTGAAERVERAVHGLPELARERLGGTVRVTVRVGGDDRPAADGLVVEPVPLQQLIIHLTTSGTGADAGADAGARQVEPAATNGGPR